MINYCLGFIFSQDLSQVVLIKKDRGIHRGYLNGVGGKCELSEIPLESMVRECFEETNIATTVDDWTFVGNVMSTFTDPEPWHVYVYAKRSLTRPWDGKAKLHEEEIVILPVDQILTDERNFATYTQTLILFARDVLGQHSVRIAIQEQ